MKNSADSLMSLCTSFTRSFLQRKDLTSRTLPLSWPSLLEIGKKKVRRAQGGCHFLYKLLNVDQNVKNIVLNKKWIHISMNNDCTFKNSILKIFSLLQKEVRLHKIFYYLLVEVADLGHISKYLKWIQSYNFTIL